MFVIIGTAKEIADLALVVQSRTKCRRSRGKVNQAMEAAVSDFKKTMQEYASKKLNHPTV